MLGKVWCGNCDLGFKDINKGRELIKRLVEVIDDESIVLNVNGIDRF